MADRYVAAPQVCACTGAMRRKQARSCRSERHTFFLCTLSLAGSHQQMHGREDCRQAVGAHAAARRLRVVNHVLRQLHLDTRRLCFRAAAGAVRARLLRRRTACRQRSPLEPRCTSMDGRCHSIYAAHMQTTRHCRRSIERTAMSRTDLARTRLACTGNHVMRDVH